MINTMNSRILLLIILIWVVSVSFAQEAQYETATVGRIVGDSPDALLKQLNADGDIDLTHATYKSSEPNSWEFWGYGSTSRSGWIQHALETKFPNQNDISLGAISWPSSWNQWSTNELFIAEPAYGKEGQICSNNEYDPCTSSADLNWGSDFEAHDPLFVLDADYGGLFLPGQHDSSQSFVGAFSQDSTMIAPTNVPSKDFVRFFVCSLVLSTVQKNTVVELYGRGMPIGWFFTNSRNNYHWNSVQPSVSSILSYSLYGLPYRRVFAPVSGLPDGNIKDYCNQGQTWVGRGVVSSGHSFMDEQVFDFGEVNVTSVGNYSVISTSNGYPRFGYQRLVLPEENILIEYPLEAVIKNVTVINFTDSEDYSVPNLPRWDSGFVNRTMYNGTCYPYSRYPSISFTRSYTSDSQIVSIKINPVEVLDCENGSFRVYRTVRYGIIYEAFSPVFLDVVSAPSEAVSGENVTVEVRVDNLINVSSSGSLFLESGGVRLFEGNVSVDSGNSSYYNVSFIMPLNESLHVFTLGFSQGNGSLTNTSFVIRTDSLKVSLASPSFLYASMGLDAFADVVNGWNVSLDSKLQIYLTSLNGSKIVLADQRLDIPANESVYSYPGLDKPAAGDYYVSLKVSSEISPGGELVSRPLHVESLGDLCSEQGNLSFNYSEGLNYSYAAYCKGNTVAVSINVSNTGENNVSTGVSYLSSSIDSVGALNVYGLEGSSPALVSPGLVSFNLSISVNSSEYGFLAVDLNDAPIILSSNHTPELSNGYSDLLFSVDWNDSEDDMSRLFVCKTSQLNESGCMDGAWCNTSFSYDNPLQCDYLVYPVDEGVNGYYAFVCDSFGACSDAFNSSFSVDAHAPNITINSPAGGSLLPYASSVWINISTDENASCRYNLSDSEFYYETDGANFTQTGGVNHGFALNVTGGQSYYLYYKCKDTAGNVNDISMDHNFSVESSVCSSGGVGICGTNYCCGAADNVCPTEFEGVTCGVFDPDCGCSHGGLSFCGGSFCCGVNDGVCPTDFDGVSCSVSDPDCSCSYGGVSICGNNFCCGSSDGVCPSSFEGISCSTSDVDCV